MKKLLIGLPLLFTALGFGFSANVQGADAAFSTSASVQAFRPPGPRPQPGHGGDHGPGHGNDHGPGHGHGGDHGPGHGPHPFPPPHPQPWPQPPPPLPPPPLPPPPPVSPCAYLVGGYAGTCRSNAGATGISFTVVDQGGACVVVNSPYFQPVALQLVNGAGVANPVGIPGGVAINQTNLAVYGAGRFAFSGFNYAGNFWFTCNN